MLVATYKCGLNIHRYSTTDLINALQLAFDVLGKLGGDTRQVVRCQKIIKHLIQAAWTLYPPNRAPENAAPRPAEVAPSISHQAEAASVPAQGSYDYGSTIDTNFGLDDLDLDFSIFTDDMSSFFPDGF